MILREHEFSNFSMRLMNRSAKREKFWEDEAAGTMLAL